MRKLGKQEQAAIEVVAEHFSATWEKGDGESPDAYATFAGKRIAVEVTAIKQSIAERGDFTQPRLRFDRVALRVVGSLQAALSEFVPDGEAVVLTITAPIRLPSRLLRAGKQDPGPSRAPPVHAGGDQGHNLRKPDPGSPCEGRLKANVEGHWFRAQSRFESGGLLRLTQSLLRHIGAAADKPLPERIPRAIDGSFSPMKLDFRISRRIGRVYSQLSISTDFKKVLMVLSGGRVEALTG